MNLDQLGTEERKVVINKIIAALDQWFWRIEDGSAQLCLPDPQGRRFTDKEVDEFIHWLDSEFDSELEKYPTFHANTGITTKGKAINVAPEFARLSGQAREAFVQDIKRLVEELSSQYKLPEGIEQTFPTSLVWPQYD